MNRQTKWDRRFLEIAEVVSRWSKDPSTRCGAVITDAHNRIVSTGYNGFTRTVEDDQRMLAEREVKYKLTIHAEVNAILFARRDLTGCSIYVHSSLPCGQCASLITQSGITAFIAERFAYPDENVEERWRMDHSLAKNLFARSGVVMRELCGICCETHHPDEVCA